MEETPDFSAAFEKIQEMLASDDGQNQIQNLLGMLSASQEEAGTESDNANHGSLLPESLPALGNGLDFETITKISGNMQALNSRQDNPKTAFLLSLKPFLTKNRQEKLDQASKLLTITSVIKAFKAKEKGGV